MAWVEMKVPCTVKQKNKKGEWVVGCGSHDAMSVDEEGIKYCFSCEQYEFPPGVKPKHTDDDESYESDYSEELLHAPSIEVPPLRQETLGRGILSSTLAKYGAGMDDEGRLWQVYYVNGRPVAAKVKFYHPDGKKDFFFVGDKNAISMYGLWCANHKFSLIITEGELDAMASFQMTGWGAVSVPFGAKTNLKYVRKVIQLLEKSERVYVCVDMDKQGRELNDKLMELFSKGKAFEVMLPHPYKDACEMLQAGKSELFKQALYSAQPRTLDFIYDKSELVRDAMSQAYDDEKRVGYEMPWPSLNEMVGGLRPGDISLFIADPGNGKSSLMRQLLYHFIRQDLKTLYIPLEDRPPVSIDQLASLHLGENVLGKDKYSDPKKLEQTLWWLVERFDMARHIGHLPLEQMTEGIEYSLRLSGVKVVILDHITAMAEASGENETSFINTCVAEFRKMCQTHNIHLCIVSHLRKGEVSKKTGVRVPDMNDIKYASSLPQAAGGGIFGLWKTQGCQAKIKLVKSARDFPNVTGNDVVVLEYDSSCGSLLEVGGHVNVDEYTVEINEDAKEEANTTNPVEESSESDGRCSDGEEQVRARATDEHQEHADGDVRTAEVPRQHTEDVQTRHSSNPEERQDAQDQSHRAEGGLPEKRRHPDASSVQAGLPDSGVHGGIEPFWNRAG